MAMKKFTVECEMPESWIQPFVSMLKKMENDGNSGHSEVVGLYADGDGSFRPKFKFQDVQVQKWSPPLPDDYPDKCIFDEEWNSEDISEWLDLMGEDATEEEKKKVLRLREDGWENMDLKL